MAKVVCSGKTLLCRFKALQAGFWHDERLDFHVSLSGVRFSLNPLCTIPLELVGELLPVGLHADF